MNEASNMLALILIASFIIDRVVTGILFLLSLNNRFRTLVASTGSGEQNGADRKYKLLYFLLATVLGILFVMTWGQLSVLASLQPSNPGPVYDLSKGFKLSLDTLLTLIILVGGADRIGALLTSTVGRGSKEASGDLVVTGKLTLVDKETTKG